MSWKPPIRDDNYFPISLVVGLGAILNTAITTGGWTEVSVPAAVFIKGFYITTRDGSNFQLSCTSDGATYITLPSGFGIDLAKPEDAILFYVRGTSSTVLEVLLAD